MKKAILWTLISIGGLMTLILGIGIIGAALNGTLGKGVPEKPKASVSSEVPKPVVKTSAPVKTLPPRRTTKPSATPTKKVTAKSVTPSPRPKTTEAKRPSPKPTQNAVPFQNCTQVREAGEAPLYPSNPRWNSKLDRDHDGVACEKK